MLPIVCIEATSHLVTPVRILVREYLLANRAARYCMANHPEVPIDHITPRTIFSLEEKARIFIDAGYRYVCRYSYPADGWFAKVYEHPDPKQPVLFVDRAYAGSRGKRNNQVIPGWIYDFPEDSFPYLLHHIAFLVDDIRVAKEEMERDGFPFQEILAGCEGKLLQVFSKPEMFSVRGQKAPVAGTVMELTSRHPKLSRTAFMESQASALMMKQSV